MPRPRAGSTSGSSWACLSAQPSRAAFVLVPPHNLEAHGPPFHSLLSDGHRPWHGQAARWAGHEVAGCDRPDNRAEVSKVGRCSEEGPRLELGGLFYPSPPPPFVGSQPPWVSSSAESCHRGCSRVWMGVRLKCPVLPCTGGMPGGCYPATGEHLWGHLAQAALSPVRNWGFSCLALHTG